MARPVRKTIKEKRTTTRKPRRKLQDRYIEKITSVMTRLMEISFRVDDHIYNGKEIRADEAEVLLPEVHKLREQSKHDPRSLQVTEKLVRVMKGIIIEERGSCTDTQDMFPPNRKTDSAVTTNPSPRKTGNTNKFNKVKKLKSNALKTASAPKIYDSIDLCDESDTETAGHVISQINDEVAIISRELSQILIDETAESSQASQSILKNVDDAMIEQLHIKTNTPRLGKNKSKKRSIVLKQKKESKPKANPQVSVLPPKCFNTITKNNKQNRKTKGDENVLNSKLPKSTNNFDILTQKKNIKSNSTTTKIPNNSLKTRACEQKTNYILNSCHGRTETKTSDSSFKLAQNATEISKTANYINKKIAVAKEIDLSWVENLKFVRHVQKTEYISLDDFSKCFWDNFDFPPNWNDSEYLI